MANWGTAAIAQSALINNFTTVTSASAQGGGIQSVGVLSMTNTTVSGNHAGGNYGGGIHLIPSTTSLALVNVTITDKEGGNFDGGLGIGGAAVPDTMVTRRREASGQATSCAGDHRHGAFEFVRLSGRFGAGEGAASEQA
jgi:hypothetical protein